MDKGLEQGKYRIMVSIRRARDMEAQLAKSVPEMR